MKFTVILLAAVLPWLVPTVWFALRRGWSVLDGRDTPSQASQLRSFGAR